MRLVTHDFLRLRHNLAQACSILATDNQKHIDMAQIYTIKCPKCGRTFEVTKGPLVSEMDKPLPEDRREDTPAVCPVCKLAIDLQDPANEKYIVSVLMVD